MALDVPMEVLRGPEVLANCCVPHLTRCLCELRDPGLHSFLHHLSPSVLLTTSVPLIFVPNTSLLLYVTVLAGSQKLIWMSKTEER